MEKYVEFGYHVKCHIERSQVKRKILLHLREPGYKATIYEIAKKNILFYANTQGNIVGEDGKYCKMRSLTHIGLLKHEVLADGAMLYSLTPKRYELAKLLEVSG